MAVKSVISFDVEDQAFANLKRRYDQFDSSVRKLPAEWRKLSVEMVGTQDLFKSMLGMSVAIAGALKEAERTEVHRSYVTDNSLRQWKHLAREARDFAASVRGATLSVAKWAGLGGILGGAGALFGLDRMAQNVAGARQFAMGVGTTIGGAAAFEVNMGRLVDPKAFLQKVSQARMTPEGYQALRAQGFTDVQIEGDVTKLAAGLIRKGKEFADRNLPRFMVGPGLRGSLLDMFFGGTDIETLRNVKKGEVEQVIGGLAAAPKMEVERPKEWQDFLTTLKDAEKQIGTVFINGLTPLVGPFENLAKSAPELLKAFLKGPTIREWINDIASGLDRFAHYVGTDDFKKNVETFAHGIELIATKFFGLISWFGRGSEPPKEEERHAARLIDMIVRGRGITLGGMGVGEVARRGGAAAQRAVSGLQKYELPQEGKTTLGQRLRAQRSGYLDPKEAEEEETLRARWRAGIMGTGPKDIAETARIYRGPALEPTGRPQLMHREPNQYQRLKGVGMGEFQSGYYGIGFESWSFTLSPQAGGDTAHILTGVKGGS